MIYAVRNERGEIVAVRRWPRPTSQTPIDENSQEWLDYLADQSREPTPDEKVNSKLLSDPVFRAVVQELESRDPGFIQAAKARL